MEPVLKSKVKTDLDSFMKGQQFFRKVGRAWKRGYLLYGAPGTRKSSLIAAMANYLKYDIYDLELTQVLNNDVLKQLMVKTTRKSIIVIEDIDCSLNIVKERKIEKKPVETKELDEDKYSCNEDNKDNGPSLVTLSGLLNITDGLWSCCGEERIIIFTTNHVTKLDPALLRPGRMEMHIHMSYCCFETFNALACSYLSIDFHPLFDVVKNLIEEGKLITPAQVAEHFFENREDPTAALEALIAWIHKSEEPKLEHSIEADEETSPCHKKRRLVH